MARLGPRLKLTGLVVVDRYGLENNSRTIVSRHLRKIAVLLLLMVVA